MTLNSIINSNSPHIIQIFKEKCLIKPEAQGLGGLLKIPNTYGYAKGET